MFIEFVESLRCVRAHEESWLVLVADRMEARNVLQGALGCPVCGARYPIADGVADFRAAGAGAAAGAQEPLERESAPPDPDEALRAAALLGLGDPGGTAALAGSWGGVAPALATIAPVHLLLVDPPFAARAAEGVSVVRTNGTLPLAAASLRGVALDERTSSPALVDSSVRALRARGRLVAPAAVPVPPAVTELARDARHWVGEREAEPSTPVGLRRRGV